MGCLIIELLLGTKAQGGHLWAVMGIQVASVGHLDANDFWASPESQRGQISLAEVYSGP